MYTVLYLLLSTLITIFVGRDLYRNGYPLILDLFQHAGFATTVNNILLTGYYLVNIGYIALSIRSFKHMGSDDAMLLYTLERIGFIMLILGILHYHNIYQLQRLSKNKDKFISFFNNK